MQSTESSSSARRGQVRRLKPAWTYYQICRVIAAGGRFTRRGGFVLIPGGRADG